MKSKHVILLTVTAFTIAACESGREKETFGTVAGAAVGGLIGSQIGSGSGSVAAGVGLGLLGAYLGNRIGKQLDDKDKMEAEKAAQASFNDPQDGQRYSWNNPTSRHSGEVTSNRTYINRAGQTCRDYATTATIASKLERATGTACQQRDGSWRVAS